MAKDFTQSFFMSFKGQARTSGEPVKPTDADGQRCLTRDLWFELNKEQGPKPGSAESGPEGQQQGGMPQGEPQQQAGMLPQGEPQQQAAPPDSQQPAPQEEGQARTSGQPAKPCDHDMPGSVCKCFTNS
ncbi:hypothetical protein COOONC_23591 [Cooperia oncophora]